MSELEKDRMLRAALSRLTEPGDPRIGLLVTDFGASLAFDAVVHRSDELGLKDDVAVRLPDCDPARELDRAARLGLRFVIPGDSEWPVQLDDLPDAGQVQQRGGCPIGLWVKGPLRLDELASSVAVVGSRSATTYGADVARDLAAVVARQDQTIVSGAAFGIDQGAHRGAIAADGRTVAVLACSADRHYPRAHQLLIDHIATTGAVVSEAPPGCPVTRVRFLARNRLIAALTAGTVVVEAAVRSGALNTANWAGRLNRMLMGVPGPVGSATSEGVHQLIRSGEATLVTNGDEVLELVAPAGAHLARPARGEERSRDRLSLRHQQILDAVPLSRPAAADSVARAAGVGLVDVTSGLIRLQELGLVSRGESGWRLTAAAGT